MVLMMPKDENEGQHMVYTAIEYDQGPIALRYPRGNALGVEMDDSFKKIPIGSWEVLKEGKDGVILTFGTTIDLALEASKKFKNQGLSIRVVNARFIKPLDEKMLKDIFAENIPVLTIEEHVLQGGFGSAVLEFKEELGKHQDVIVERMGIPDRFIEHGSISELWSEIGLTEARVIEKLKAMMSKKLRA